MGLERITSREYIDDEEINKLGEQLKEAKKRGNKGEINVLIKDINDKYKKYIREERMINQCLSSHGEDGIKSLQGTLEIILDVTRDKESYEYKEHLHFKKRIDSILELNK